VQLAFGLSAPELGFNPLPLALSAAALTAVLVFYEMLTRDGVSKSVATGTFISVLVIVLVVHTVL
jgi:hypothetical protein